jgi:O-6-methylguanine DNA methyltransferase
VRVTRQLYVVDGWGVGELWHEDGVLVQHELASPDLERELERNGQAVPADSCPAAGPAAPMGGTKTPTGTLTQDPTRVRAGVVPDLCRRFELHLRGTPVGYDDVELDLEWATPFQAALAESARAIPWGEVVSYGELAASAGRRGAARAAGSFCAENRFALVIPCHRIVAAGGIGGYGSGGVGLKRRLLALEGVDL